MKRILRTISVLLILALSCSLLSISALAVEQEVNLEDAALLYGLGISETPAEEGNMKIVLTRAEFLAMLMSFEKDGFYGTGEQHFVDVPADHDYFDAIDTAYALGVIKGDGKGSFNPDYPITYAQASVMLLRYMGYESASEDRGGYFVGYALMASQLGLDDGLSCSADDILRYNQVSRLVVNALDIPIVQFSGVSDGHVISDSKDGKTLLTEKLKLNKGTGIISVNENTSLPSNEHTQAGNVVINNIVYNAAGSGAKKYLGYTVDYYYDVNDESLAVKPLVYVTPAGRNTTITIHSSDIVNNGDLSKTRLPYSDENGKVKNAKISPYADLIYNGVSVGSYSIGDMTPYYGSVTLVDNDEDGLYDLLLVSAYTTILVGDISSSSSMIYDYYNTSVNASLSTEDGDTVEIYAGEDLKTFASIKKMQVVSVAQSGTGSRRQTIALISSDSITGTVRSTTDDSVVINDIKYEVVPGTFEKVLDLKAGASGKFYLDAFGRVAGYIKDDAALNQITYGYLLNAGVTKGIDSKLQIKIMTAQGMKTYSGAESILIDDTKYTNKAADVLVLLNHANTYYNLLSEADKTSTTATAYAQIVRYSLNADSEVKMLDTLSPLTTPDDDNENDKLKLDVAKGSSTRYYSRPSRSIGKERAEFAMNENTVCFRIPELGRENEEDEYEVGSVGMDGNGCHSILYPARWHYVEAYNKNKVQVAEAVIVTNSGSEWGESTGVGLVTSLTEAIDEGGNNTYKLMMAEAGRLNEYTLREAELITNADLNEDTVINSDDVLERGDVIVFTYTSGNVITRVGKAVDLSKDNTLNDGDVTNDLYVFKGYGSNAGYFYANPSIFYGYIEDKVGDQVSVAYYDGGTKYTMPYDLASFTGLATMYYKGRDTSEFVSASELAGSVHSGGSRNKVVLVRKSGVISDAYIFDESY